MIDMNDPQGKIDGINLALFLLGYFALAVLLAKRIK